MQYDAEIIAQEEVRWHDLSCMIRANLTVCRVLSSAASSSSQTGSAAGNRACQREVSTRCRTAIRHRQAAEPDSTIQHAATSNRCVENPECHACAG